MKKNFLFMALAAMAFTATAFTGCKKDDPTPEPVKVSSVAFKATPSEALEIGDEFTFEVTVLPENAENKSVTWASSNTAVATVSAGKVTALAAGKTTVSATAADGSGKKAEFEITVAEEPVYVAITGDGFDITDTQAINKSEVGDAKIKINISVLNGVENFLIDIDCPVLDPMLAMGQTGLDGEFDLANLTPAQAGAMGSMGGMGLALPFGAAVKGKTEVEFELGGAFFASLFGLGEIASVPEFPASFKMTVKDADGNEDSQTLTLNFVDDLKLEITGSVGETPIEINMSDALAEPIAIDPVAVDVVAPQGIETFVVEIDSSSDAFKAALTIFKITGAFDLADPGEELAASLTTVGLLDPEKPIKDATEVTFDVTKFIPLIFQVRSQMSQETGNFTADFKLTVTDKKGTTKEATIKLSLIDDSAAE